MKRFEQWNRNPWTSGVTSNDWRIENTLSDHGSLTTDKEFPKDIDLLVTATDDCELEPLAQLGRRL